MIKKDKIRYVIIAIVILTTGLIYSFFLSGKYKEDTSVIINSESENQESTNSSSSSKIFVYVCGYVLNPGVYEFNQGERVFNAIEKAGGVIDEADTENINLADILQDGQKIQIKSSSVEALGEESDGRVDINTATLDTLMSLPGIGETKAQGIISYRDSGGFFYAVEDIMLVEGIKETLFSKIKDLIKV